MANVIICSAAEIDFTQSLKWYAERSIEAANDFDAEFDRAMTVKSLPIQSDFRCVTLDTAISCFVDFPFALFTALLGQTSL